MLSSSESCSGVRRFVITAPIQSHTALEDAGKLSTLRTMNMRQRPTGTLASVGVPGETNSESPAYVIVHGCSCRSRRDSRQTSERLANDQIRRRRALRCARRDQGDIDSNTRATDRGRRAPCLLPQRDDRPPAHDQMLLVGPDGTVVDTDDPHVWSSVVKAVEREPTSTGNGSRRSPSSARGGVRAVEDNLRVSRSQAYRLMKLAGEEGREEVN